MTIYFLKIQFSNRPWLFDLQISHTIIKCHNGLSSADQENGINRFCFLATLWLTTKVKTTKNDVTLQMQTTGLYYKNLVWGLPAASKVTVFSTQLLASQPNIPHYKDLPLPHKDQKDKRSKANSSTYTFIKSIWPICKDTSHEHIQISYDPKLRSLELK